MNYLISGAAGFIGSHLSEKLAKEGHSVFGLDNYATGTKSNIEGLSQFENFEFIEHDISRPLETKQKFDRILHFASAASPPDYLRLTIETLEVGSKGTQNLLELAQACKARFLLASTSEIYGDPAEHPQRELYWGNVNPVGPRSVYDEAKRYAEAITMAYHRRYSTDVRIARIFNTYGPRMRPNDGRVISNFIVQAMKNQPITIYGDGTQTRSICYVDDEVDGILSLLECNYVGPVNIGNHEELSVREIADIVLDVVPTTSTIEYRDLPQDDPTRRRPDISLITRLTGWQPLTPVGKGIQQTYEYFKTVVQ